MSNLSKVAEDVKGLAKKFQAILDLGAALDEIGSLEQAKRDAESSKDGAYKCADEAKAAKERALKELEIAKLDVSNMQDQCAALLDNANQKAAAIIEKAQAQAQQIAYAWDKKQSDMDEKFSLACKELVKIQDEIVSKKGELEEVKAQISSIKMKLQAFVGGG